MKRSLRVGVSLGVAFFLIFAALVQAYEEAPMLKAKVEAGILPPVEERVSKEPLVVEPTEEIGQYGGTWRRLFRGPSDFHAYGRCIYEPITRWARDPKKGITPGIAKSWKFSPDGKILTLYLRKGMKWSDGAPFTADDILFWWEDIACNPDLYPSPPPEWSVGGEPMKVEKVDDYTVRLRFAAPHGLAIQFLAYKGNQWPLAFERWGFFAPKHYLKDFHPRYNPAMKDYKLFEEKAYDLNTERPALTAWTAKEWIPGDRLIAERNPYYWKIDPAGNQLPYIDRIYLDVVETGEVINFRALAGEVDMQCRGMSLENYSLFMDGRERGNYRVLRWPSASGANPLIMPNYTCEDKVLRGVIQDKRFRYALSLAIDRETINELCFLGLCVPRQASLHPDSPYYVPETSQAYAEYDPERANALLDEMGLTERDGEGFRLRPDGKTLKLTIDTATTAGPGLDALELVKEYWEAIGVKTAIKSEERTLFWKRTEANEHEVAIWGMDRGLEPLVDPIWIVPVRFHSWYATAYGKWYESGGEVGEEPTGDLRKVQKLFDEIKVTVDRAKQIELAKEICKINAENIWAIGTVGLSPSLMIAKNNFRNIPEVAATDWIYMSPGNLCPEQFFFKQK